MNFKKQAVIGLSALVLTAVVLPGCANKESTTETKSPASSAAATKPKEPTPISIMSTFFTAEPPTADNVIQKEIEKRTNTKLTITWVAQNNYVDKANVTLASGDIPDLILSQDPYAAQITSMIEQGAFWNLTPYLKNYPNLMKFPQEAWTYTKAKDGNNYGIPKVRPTEGNGYLSFRKDWLTKLNLTEPKTMDDIYKVWKAFAENDPDGNGKKDTFGYSANVRDSDMSNFAWVENVFNQTNGLWKLKDGKLTNTVFENGTRESLLWLNKAFTEGLIPQDFAVMKLSQSDDLVKASKSGSYFNTVESSVTFELDTKKNAPGAQFVVIPSVQGPLGAYAQRDAGNAGMFLIPKKVSEEKVKQILAFMDYGASDEGSTLASYGLKDVHYTEKDGFKTLTEKATSDNVSNGIFGQIFSAYDKYSRAYNPKGTVERYTTNKKVIDDGSKISLPKVYTGLFSETGTKFGADLGKKIQDMKIKVMMSKATIQDWDAFVAGLKNDANLTKWTQEMNDSYVKREGKK